MVNYKTIYEAALDNEPADALAYCIAPGEGFIVPEERHIRWATAIHLRLQLVSAADF